MQKASLEKYSKAAISQFSRCLSYYLIFHSPSDHMAISFRLFVGRNKSLRYLLIIADVAKEKADNYRAVLKVFRSLYLESRQLVLGNSIRSTTKLSSSWSTLEFQAKLLSFQN